MSTQPIDELVKEGEKYPFTEDDLKKLTNNKYKLYLYEDLEEIDNIEQLLGENKGFILLYEVGAEYDGHWISIFTRPNNILEIFDPLGLDLDEEIQYSDYQVRRHNGAIVPHLTHLVEKSKYKIVTNKTKLQESIKDVNTCGRHAGFRLKHRDLSLEEFVKLFDNKYYTPDWFITIMTSHFGSFNE
jgi:hypothetical protein